MKTIKQLLLTVAVLLCSVAVSAHDFEVDGIYYNITSTENLMVEVTCKGTYHYDYPNEYNCEVVIPEKVNYNGKVYSVTRIGANAFEGCSVTNVTIPNSVTRIGANAFDNCSSLTSVIIPNSVTSIGANAFQYCSGLTNITIPNSVTSIGAGAFIHCSSLKSVSLSNSITEISSLLFYNCSAIEHIVIPSSVKSISSYVFKSSSLRSVVIGDSVTSVDSRAFEGSGIQKIINCSNLNLKEIDTFNYLNSCIIINVSSALLQDGFVFNGNTLCGYIGDATEIVLPNNYQGGFYTIDNYTFYGHSNLKSINIPNGVKSIGNKAFYGCVNLTDLTIGNSVTSIGNSAFEDCSGLTSVIIPNSVTSIESYAFYGCTNLERICMFPRIAISCNNNVFSESTYNNALLYVPQGREFAYSKTEPWSNFYIQGMKNYNVTYKIDGEVYETYSVECFAEIPMPDIPTKDGYTFMGWSEIPSYMPEKDIVINGSFAVNKYAVTYVVDGDTITTDSIAYGAEITPIAVPEKEGYTFCGWSEVPVTMPANDIIIRGSFEINTYVVTYIVDGVTYATDSIVFNGDVNVISAPEKEGHTFSGWSYAPKKMPAENITISGSFSVNYYTITYIVDGVAYDSLAVAYGSEITLIAAPEKEGYTFSGWSDAPATMPAEDIIITGSFVHTSINSVSVEATVKVNGNSIALVGAENCSVAVYSTGGALVEKIDAYSGEEITLDKGVYIVRVGDKAMKVKL